MNCCAVVCAYISFLNCIPLIFSSCKRNFFKPDATPESMPTNPLHTLWNYDICKIKAIIKGVTTNACYAITNYYARKVDAILEGMLRNSIYSVTEFRTRKTFAILEDINAQVLQTTWYCYTC